MYRLVRRSDGAVLQVCEGDFQEFLNTKYGGYFAVKTENGILSGAARYDAYWEEVVELCEKLTGAKSPSTPNC